MKKTNFKTALVAGSLIAAIGFIVNCNDTPTTDNNTQTVLDTITPVPFPGTTTTGIRFPEDSTTIYNWLNNSNYPSYDSARVIGHAWGIWAGLTAQSGEVYQGDSMLVYQTWSGINDLVKTVATGTAPVQTSRAEFMSPRQSFHAAALRNEKLSLKPQFWVTVNYDPMAASYAVQNQIFKLSVLKSFAKPNGIGNIPAFPTGAITIKPTYYVGKTIEGFIKIPAWQGPPATAQDYPSTDWNSYVYVDVNNTQPAGKIAVPVSNNCTNKDSINGAKVNANEFISFKIDKAMADYINAEQGTGPGQNATAGDLAVLVAMHVAAKEIANWTWQTFYWTTNPDQPDFPSSTVAAAARKNAPLSKAAAHYALSEAYLMVLGNQPIVGGTNTGVKAHVGYNPYLEPGLGAINGTGKGFTPNDLDPNFKWGMQSNCMSCHALASCDTLGNGNAYTADQYISMNDTTRFKNMILLDFAWSIQQSILKNK